MAIAVGFIVGYSVRYLGKGMDQIRMEYGSSLDVQSDLILGDGKDKFISRGNTSIKGDFYTGAGDDYVEIRGESPVGYGKITITGKVDLGEGDDLFLLKNPIKDEFSLVNKQLSLGAGDDVVDIRLEGTRLLIGKASDAESKNFSLNFGLGNDTGQSVGISSGRTKILVEDWESTVKPGTVYVFDVCQLLDT